ncbi:tumor necrosis factor receptor superfamily member 26-like [Lethenteron reissneri]|uniref:tumor necrosis factor receptor superfamily member 26-like n=1 Tax=Lethenteron reissneri TaxID=7753 RepID=UPI002AB69AA6|nr:tumor necrosis factor receptor superfamily member 26-like [Lethenteron reissneri]
MTSRRNPAGLTMGVKLLLMISLLHKLSLAKECGDGFHESQQGICCKLCPAGTYKMYSCIHNGSRAACDLCPTGSFMDRDNWEEKCTQCKSCGPDEEVALACSVAQDTVCQCMKGLKRDADSGVCLNEKTHTDDAAATSAIVLACLLTLILVVFTVILLFRMRKPRWSTLKLKFNPSGVTNAKG